MEICTHPELPWAWLLAAKTGRGQGLILIRGIVCVSPAACPILSLDGIALALGIPLVREGSESETIKCD
jgi:hypothetical protein